MKRVVALMTGLILLMALAAFAQATKTKAPQAPKPKAPVTKSASGTISTVSDTALVITHKVKGKDEQTTFVLNAQTRKTGDLAVGAHAMVHYTVENNQNIATSVTVTPTKAKAVTTKKK
jgi:hypothetical protein